VLSFPLVWAFWDVGFEILPGRIVTPLFPGKNSHDDNCLQLNYAHGLFWTIIKIISFSRELVASVVQSSLSENHCISITGTGMNTNGIKQKKPIWGMRVNIGELVRVSQPATLERTV
jgi:hypothetical protein